MNPVGLFLSSLLYLWMRVDEGKVGIVSYATQGSGRIKSEKSPIRRAV